MSWRRAVLRGSLWGVVAALALLVWGRMSSETRESAAEPEPATAQQSTKPPVQVGLERLADREADFLRGQRIGLVVHAASVTADGRHAIDVLRDLDLEVVRLFSPEHGLRGRAAAGEEVASGLDPVTGLPVVSLYGEILKPMSEELKGLDSLVFDLQGAGVRFYTYVSTMMLCLEAAAEAGVRFVVLDRPNPLGGERIEGPVSAPREVVPASFVNLAPGPLVHGMTMGEMARLVNSHREQPADLEVIPMLGWERHMVWEDTGRPWISPSPNLRSAEAALAYPGTAFLEATNVSEGRGTTDPFLMIGAPWLDPAAISVSVPGFELVTTTFTPESSPAAPNPKYLNEKCRGFRVKVTDPVAAQPYRLGVSLVRELRRQPEFEWLRDGVAMTRLIGDVRLPVELDMGSSIGEILALDEDDHEAWRRERRPFLLY